MKKSKKVKKTVISSVSALECCLQCAFQRLLSDHKIFDEEDEDGLPNDIKSKNVYVNAVSQISSLSNIRESICINIHSKNIKDL